MPLRTAGGPAGGELGQIAQADCGCLGPQVFVGDGLGDAKFVDQQFVANLPAAATAAVGSIGGRATAAADPAANGGHPVERGPGKHANRSAGHLQDKLPQLQRAQVLGQSETVDAPAETHQSNTDLDDQELICVFARTPVWTNSKSVGSN